MENISSVQNSDYASYIQEMIRTNATVGVNSAVMDAADDILDTLIEGTFQMDSEVPENSTFSLHV